MEVQNVVRELLMECEEIDRATAEDVARYLQQSSFYKWLTGEKDAPIAAPGGESEGLDSSAASAAALAAAAGLSGKAREKYLEDQMRAQLRLQSEQVKQMESGATVVQRSRAGAGMTTAVACGSGVTAAASVEAPKVNEAATGAVGAAARAKARAPRMPLANRLLFRKADPRRVPLIQRWWVPWVCIGSIVLVWTPDIMKLRAIYKADHQYTQLKFMIHSWYWRMTMDEDKYKLLMKQLEEGVPRSLRVKSTDCPL